MKTEDACVVLYGPPLAGKRTLMDRIGGLSAGAPSVTREPAIECQQNSDIGSRLTFTIGARRVSALTFSGGVWNEDLWLPLIYRASAVILVLDGQRTRQDADMEFVEKLEGLPRLSRLGCVALTKQDLGKSDVEMLSARELLAGKAFAAWPVFLTRAESTAETSRLLKWLGTSLEHM